MSKSIKTKSVKVKSVKKDDVETKMVPLVEQMEQEVVQIIDQEKESMILILEGEIMKLDEQLKSKRMALRLLKGKGPSKKREGPTKMDKAKEIFERMNGQPRKDVILAFISEAGLTKAGAQTYWSNLKKV
ncbi:MAG: hypothetical protein ACYCZQ_03195 [Burkholderiales bacterium]